MKTCEIFYSMQGEGKWMGLPNIFIRTTGCNLRCSYCDTKYAYSQGIEKTIKEILSEITKYSCKHICITGGEPLLQKKEILEITNILLEKNYKILIETNGSIGISDFKNKKNLIISMDIKCPSSQMHEKMLFTNISLLEKKDQIKLILKNKKDYEYAKKIIHTYKPKCDIYFQPVWNKKIDLAKWMLKDNLNVKLGVQLHKILNLK